MLVALAAAILDGLGQAMVRVFAEQQSEAVLRADPFRILEAIIAGISFLGAGTILRNRRDASQWVLAEGSAIFAWMALRLVGALERRWT